MKYTFILLITMLLPLGLWAQQDAPKPASQQYADSKIMEKYPNATQVDLEKLTKQQAGQHEKGACASCPKKQKKSASQQEDTRDLATLKADKQRLMDKLKSLKENDSLDKATYTKYKKAILSLQTRIEQYQAKSSAAKKK